MRFFWLRRLFLIIALAGLAWLIFLGFSIWSFGNNDHARSSDCAIVLGAAVIGNKPSPVFLERVQHSVALFRAGLVKKIIFTGGYGKGESHAESEVAAEYAISMGIPREAIFTENRSRTTRQNLMQAKEIMDRKALHSAILISDPLHLKRSSLIAEDLEISAVTSPTPTSRYRSWKTQIPFLLRELYFYHHDFIQ